jgi:hypothetical protein
MWGYPATFLLQAQVISTVDNRRQRNTAYRHDIQLLYPSKENIVHLYIKHLVELITASSESVHPTTLVTA